MDDIDRELLNVLQRDFPVTETPYADVGECIGIGEDEVLARIESLKSEGLIRRIGASFNPRKLGYTSTLAAARVPREKIDSAAEFINKYPQVTHNYERDDEFNLWFTVIARGEDEIERILDEIRSGSGAEEVIGLPATDIFKIDVKFDLTKKGDS